MFERLVNIRVSSDGNIFSTLLDWMYKRKEPYRQKTIRKKIVTPPKIVNGFVTFNSFTSRNNSF